MSEQTITSDNKDKKSKTSKSRREAAVQGTNDNSIVSKCSMANQGYVQDDYLQRFVAKVMRRAPLIHRGYYIRAKVIEHIVGKFLGAIDGLKQIVSLGAGFDSAYFRLYSEGLLENTVYCEVDFPELVKRKRALIEMYPDMVDMIGETSKTVAETSPHIEMCSEKYKLLGVDLSQKNILEAALKLAGIQFDVPTLVLSECVLTYMTHRCASGIVYWACETFSNSVFVLYEQINPNDAFGLFMQKHYYTVGSPLKCINHFPTLQSQIDRVKKLGWPSVQALDMNGFYNELVTRDERRRVESLEPFDECEEWHLKCAHYFVLCAHQGTVPAMLDGVVWSPGTSDPLRQPDCVSLIKPPVSNPLLRRFGHGSGKIGQHHVFTVGGFGDQKGKHMRVTDMIILDLATFHKHAVSPGVDNKIIEGSRMHATLSSLRDGRQLLIGGRLSPMKLCSQIVAIEVHCTKHLNMSDPSNCDEYTEKSSCDKIENAQMNNLRETEGVMDTQEEDKTQGSKSCEKAESPVVNTAGVESNISNEGKTDEVDVICTVIPQTGDIPCPRWRHTAVEYREKGEERVIMYGGRTQTVLALGDCYAFSTSTNQWKKIETTGNLPEPRQSHTANIWNGHMIIAGGLQDDLRPVNSVHLLDLDSYSWSSLQCNIEPRYSHTSHVIGDYLLLIGGVNFSHSPPGVAVVHLPSGTSQEFSLPVADKDNLLMLHGHTSVALDNSRILLLGGGGNCFSFGTHLNATPFIIDIQKTLDFMEQNRQS